MLATVQNLDYAAWYFRVSGTRPTGTLSFWRYWTVSVCSPRTEEFIAGVTSVALWRCVWCDHEAQELLVRYDPALWMSHAPLIHTLTASVIKANNLFECFVVITPFRARLRRA
jgi:hypothetical protein